MNSVGEQISLFDQNIWSGKMFPVHSLREKTETENRSKEKTSAASSKRSPKSSKKTFAFLDLRGGGHGADASSWTTEALLGAYMMPNISVCHSEGSACVSWLTSTDLLRQGFCLTLNLSECPREANPTLLSEILEEETDARYNLSSRACQGILNRANKRGKKLPEILQEALEAQVMA